MSLPLSVIGYRLPRRGPRRVHGRARPRRGRRRRRRGQGRRAARRQGAVLRARPRTSCCRGARHRPAAVHHRRRGGRRRATCTSSASAPRRSAGEYAADLRYVDAAVDSLRPAPAPGDARRRASPPCRSAPPPGSPSCSAERARRRAVAGLEPRVPARGLRRRGHRCTPTGSSSASPRPTRRAPHRAAGPGLRRAARRRARPLVVTDYATAELVKVAANSFLATKISFINAMAEVCEATGADVVAARRRDRPRRPDRPQVPQRRPRLRRRLPAQGHPRVHGPRRRARRRPGADLPARGRRDQPAPPRPGWSTWPARSAAARSLGKRVAVLGAAFKPEQRRHPRLPRARRRRAAHHAGRRRSPCTTPRRWRTPARSGPT